jgi:hypothetical protein
LKKYQYGLLIAGPGPAGILVNDDFDFLSMRSRRNDKGRQQQSG